MEDLGYYNGKYDRIENMTVPMNDRACYFGDGLFEVAYCRNRKIYALSEHMDRLYASAEALGINIPITEKEFSALIYEMSGKVDSHEQIIYWQVSRGTAPRNHAPAEGMMANIWIMIRPKVLVDIYTPMKLITVEDTRFFHCNMKTLNLIPTVMASREAEMRGAEEAVFHRGDRVTECAHSNISIITDEGVVKTAPADEMILAGVARAHFINKCHELSIPVVEEPYTVAEMMAAAEIIVTSSGTLCRPACEIDGISVGGRAPKLLKALQDGLLGDFMRATDI